MSTNQRYIYGMRLRPFSIGAQPKQGLIDHQNAEGKYSRYWDLIIYDRQLTEEECFVYSLDLLETENGDGGNRE